MKAMLCRACGVEHDPLWRCTDPRIVVTRHEVTTHATNVVVTNPPVTLSKTSRQVVWQQANRERYNAKMRAYRKKRAAGLTASKLP